MNGTTLERPDVAASLEAVRSRLADLPAEERDDLVADVEASLLEAGEPPLLSPREFAAELREAAGLTPEPAATMSPSFLASLRSWLVSERAASWRQAARELAPIWWLTRAYVAVVLIALAAGWGWPVGSGSSGSLIAVGQSIAALMVVVAISIWLGLRGKREKPSRRRLVLAVNVALAIALVPVATYSLDRLTHRSLAPYTVPEPTPGLAVDGLQLTNLFPYTRDGKPLFDVLLYDAFGRPVEIFPGAADPLRRVLVGADGSRYFNSYPIRYFEPGTTTVAQPTLGPTVKVPEIVTPPLRGN